MVMLRGVVPTLEKHHGVRILEEAVSVLDTACARLALGHSSTPPPIEEATRLLDDLNVQERILRREAAAGADHAERLGQIVEEKSKVQARLQTLNEHFEKERTMVAR